MNDDKELINMEHARWLINEVREPVSDDALSALGNEMIDKIRERAVKSDPNIVVHEMNDEFFRKAMMSCFEGAKAVIESGQPLVPVQFAFTGLGDKKSGKLHAEVIPQGMGIIDDKRVIVKAVREGVERVAGKIFVVLADEAYMAKIRRDDPRAKLLETGAMNASELPEKEEVIMLTGIGYGVQYVMSSKVIRKDGKRTVEQGEIISNKDKDVEFKDDFNLWGKPQ